MRLATGTGALPRRPAPAAAVTSAREIDEPASTPRHPGNTLDLRGERVEDALARADKFLDESLRANHENVFFIHGHGTGALRNALREHLAGSPAVSTIRPGEKSEGGDGVTVATLS